MVIFTGNHPIMQHPLKALSRAVNAMALLPLFILTNGPLSAQSPAPPGLSAIRTEDLTKDLYALADAHFKGRSAGTLDELKASAWLAEKFRAIGLKPAGDDGTY